MPKAKADKYEKYLQSVGIKYLRNIISIPYINTQTGKLKSRKIEFVLLTDPPQWIDTSAMLKPTDWRIAIIRHTKKEGIIYRTLNEIEEEYIRARHE